MDVGEGDFARETGGDGGGEVGEVESGGELRRREGEQERGKMERKNGRGRRYCRIQSLTIWVSLVSVSRE
jgi:hypothetical protein